MTLSIKENSTKEKQFIWDYCVVEIEEFLNNFTHIQQVPNNICQHYAWCRDEEGKSCKPLLQWAYDAVGSNLISSELA